MCKVIVALGLTFQNISCWQIGGRPRLFMISFVLRFLQRRDLLEVFHANDACPSMYATFISLKLESNSKWEGRGNKNNILKLKKNMNCELL